MTRRRSVALLSALLCCAAARAMASGPYDAMILADPSLAHYWDGSSLSDRGPGGPATLACTGTCATAQTLGVNVKGYTATQYLSVTTTLFQVQNGSPAFSFEIWINGTNTSTEGGLFTGGSYAYITIENSPNPGAPKVSLSGVVSASILAPSGGYANGAAHLVTMACGPTGNSQVGTCDLLVDGVLQTGSPATYQISTDVYPGVLYLGGQSGGSVWGGAFGGVAVYRGERISAATALAHYQCGALNQCGAYGTLPPAPVLLQ